ncbi:MAG: HlyD family efflux transporter periplasmic adaptor subunit [Blastocatellia bacterium]|nr:HlyD family efflux transporter periplasmic adaptor subunit [Blastocatellia bacterium]
MDIPRLTHNRNRALRFSLYLVAGCLLVAGAASGLARLKPAAPAVNRSAVWIDSVKRGDMLRQVRGIGTLVPEEIRWIPAPGESRVERILVRPGTTVKPETVLVELTNPEKEQAVVDTEFQLRAAAAEYQNLRVRLESSKLDQKAVAAKVAAESSQARLRADADEELAKQGLVSPLSRKISKVTAEELQNRAYIEEQRLAIATDSVQPQLEVQQARIEQLKALLTLNRSKVAALQVRAGIAGVVQQIPVEVGQQVAQGTLLAKVANPARLKAQVKIPETQARDIAVGLTALIDTRNGMISGSVARVDPAVQQGTVTVDVVLTGELPKGARPDLTVDGTIELERLRQVLFVGRPVFSQEQAALSLMKLDREGQFAARTKVKLGRNSVDTVEILEGLQEGDRVILSDMSAWDTSDRIQLK